MDNLPVEHKKIKCPVCDAKSEIRIVTSGQTVHRCKQCGNLVKIVEDHEPDLKHDRVHKETTKKKKAKTRKVSKKKKSKKKTKKSSDEK